MVQNVQHWLLERDRFRWAREHVTATKWYQITKYFPGYKLRRQMMYVDAETGEPISAEGGEEVPAGKVYFYGYDLRNFCGIDVPGLDEAMTATRKSRLEQRAVRGDPAARPASPPAQSPPAGPPTDDTSKSGE
jgi:hypothetical protein